MNPNKKKFLKESLFIIFLIILGTVAFVMLFGNMVKKCMEPSKTYSQIQTQNSQKELDTRVKLELCKDKLLRLKQKLDPNLKTKYHSLQLEHQALRLHYYSLLNRYNLLQKKRK